MTATDWIQAGLDVVLIVLVGAGLVQAARLLHHLAGLRQGRFEMAQFVQEFSSTVLRAEVGIKGLKQAARESGDDLEKLIEKAVLLRDELQFLVESADQIAGRLGDTAAGAVRAIDKAAAAKASAAPIEAPPAPAPKASEPAPLAAKKAGAKASSRAEKELLQALEKLG